MNNKELVEILNKVYKYPITLLNAYMSDYKEVKAQYEFLASICMLEIEGIDDKKFETIAKLR